MDDIPEALLGRLDMRDARDLSRVLRCLQRII